MKHLLKSMIAGALSVPLLVAAGPASAEVLDQNKVGSALALLFVTADENVYDGAVGFTAPAQHMKDQASPALPIVTSIVVTNTSVTEGIVLAAEVINGDPGEHWTGQSFRCPMTPGETTQLVFSPDGIAGSSNSVLKYECSVPFTDPFSPNSLKSIPKTTPLAASMGILWLTIEGAAYPNPTLSKNILEGKSVVLNFMDGTAYEVGAVPFQSPSPEWQNFDSVYQFNGRELARWPESLTSSFHAPSFNVVPPAAPSTMARDVRAQLVLFTLDGRLSSHIAPNAEAVVYFFNDDEEFFNTSLYFSCFLMIELEDIDSRFLKQNLGSATGHLEIVPQSVDPADENHDAMFANDDNKRRVPIAGWLVQKLESGGRIMDAVGMQYPMPANANANDSAWGSLLSTSMTPLPNESGDTPTLTR